MDERLRDVCEELEWKVMEDDAGCVELEKHSPAGEDFIVTVWPEDQGGLSKAVMDYADGFDADEHVRGLLEAKHNGFAGVPPVTTLAKDAEDIETMLYELAYSLEEAESYYAKMDLAFSDCDDEKKKAVTCAILGHSKIVTTFFGYVNCARCGAQIGDALGGMFDGSKVVIVGHDCDVCRANYKKLTWKDKVLAPYPFKREEEGADGSR